MAIITSDDAADLISKFKSEGILLRIFFRARDRSFNSRLTARISGFTGSRVFIMLQNGDFTLLDIEHCRFEYNEPREIPDEELREAASEKIAGSLSIFFPSGDKVDLVELR